MPHALYTLLLLALLLITLPLWVWRYFRTAKYRDTVAQRLGFRLPDPPPGPRIWIHAVSVGEVIAAQGMIRHWATRFPQDAILLSTVTKTGQQIARTIPGVCATFYLPLDLPWIVRRVTRTLRPRCLMVLETELWPNLFQAMAAEGIPVILVNGRLSPRSFRHYRLFAHFMRRFLAPVQLFAMQSVADAERMQAIGAAPERVHATGNVKYDQAMQPPDPAKMAELAHRLPRPEGLIWLAASTHPGEEAIILDCFSHLQNRWPTLRLLLVPRHPERGPEVFALVQKQGGSCARFSRMTGTWTESILLVDQVGWLTRLYGYAHLAFVGGSLIPHGGQNMLEPASHGLPILFGPHTFNFKDVVRQLLEADAAIQLEGSEGLLPALDALLADPPRQQAMGERARQVIAHNTGAVERTLQAIQTLLERPPTP